MRKASQRSRSRGCTDPVDLLALREKSRSLSAAAGGRKSSRFALLDDRSTAAPHSWAEELRLAPRTSGESGCTRRGKGSPETEQCWLHRAAWGSWSRARQKRARRDRSSPEQSNTVRRPDWRAAFFQFLTAAPGFGQVPLQAGDEIGDRRAQFDKQIAVDFHDLSLRRTAAAARRSSRMCRAAARCRLAILPVATRRRSWTGKGRRVRPVPAGGFSASPGKAVTTSTPSRRPLAHAAWRIKGPFLNSSAFDAARMKCVRFAR